MRIERLARKIEPLRPDLVRRWRQVRDSGQGETLNLVELHMRAAARTLLGDYEKKPLLSLPPSIRIRGTFRLGDVLYERRHGPAGLTETELLQHVAIFGRSGAGKTNAAFLLLGQLAQRKTPFLFLDWKRTCRHFLPQIKRPVFLYTAGRSLSPFPFNPFLCPPGVEHRVYANQVVDTLAEALTLGEGSKSLLQKALRHCYAELENPTLGDVRDVLDTLTLDRRAREWKVSTLRALDTLEGAGMGTATAGEQGRLVETLLAQNTILELDGLAQSVKRFLIPLLCQWLFHVKLGTSRRERLDFVVFLEEAHHVLYRQDRRAKEAVVNTFVRQCREIGIAVILVDQHAHLISSAALGNTFTTVILNQKDPRDLDLLARLALVPEDEKRLLTTLPVGQAVVKLQDRWTNPFVIEIPLVPVQKGVVTDSLLLAAKASSGAVSGLKLLETGGRGTVGEFRPKDRELDSGDLALLTDVLHHPEDGVAQRYRRLGWSGDRGHRVKESLIRRGMLDAATVRTGNTRRVVLGLPKAIAETLAGAGNTDPRESLVHAYWKRIYAQRLERLGYRVRVETSRNGGAFDLLATKPGETLAIEVETGKSNVVSNVRRGLRAAVDRVVVVATDEQALARVERQLVRAGLVVPRRIHLVLRDGYFTEKNR